MSSPLLLPEFLAFVSRQRLIPRGSRVIAAVSGGADSTCLAHLLLESRERLGITLEIAHVNHQLRGRESDRDAAAVAALANAHGLRFHIRLGTAFTPEQRRGASMQELARELRLGFLLDLARRRRALVALGHTADDQAETLLMRFVAASGPAGLGGIQPASHGGRLVHPLLFARRHAIEEWLGARGVRWRNDRSNRRRHYLRNRVRLDLLPLIARDFNPRIVERLGMLAHALRRDNECLETLAVALLKNAAAGPRRYRFPREVLTSAHPAVLARALLAALRAVARQPADFSSRHLEALLAAGDPGARSWDLPGGVRGQSDGAGLLLLPADVARRPTPGFRSVALRVPGSAALAGAGVMAARVVPRRADFDPRAYGADPRRVALDWDCLRPPLAVRSRLPGDRFRPLDLPDVKKLKELLIDAGIPATGRSRVPLVCDKGGIVWVAGLRPAERCRVHSGTRRLLLLEFVGR